MKRTLFLLPLAALALFATSAGVLAQDEKPKRQGAAERIKTLTEKLTLTEEQQGKLKAILEKNQPKMKELRADTALSAEDKKAKVAELRKAETEEIRALLTPEQQEKMKELRKQAKPAAK